MPLITLLIWEKKKLTSRLVITWNMFHCWCCVIYIFSEGVCMRLYFIPPCTCMFMSFQSHSYSSNLEQLCVCNKSKPGGLIGHLRDFQCTSRDTKIKDSKRLLIWSKFGRLSVWQCWRHSAWMLFVYLEFIHIKSSVNPLSFMMHILLSILERQVPDPSNTVQTVHAWLLDTPPNRYEKWWNIHTVD